MSWFLNTDNRNNDNDNDKRIMIFNAPIKKVQAFRILADDEDNCYDDTENAINTITTTMSSSENGLINIDAVREILGIKRR